MMETGVVEFLDNGQLKLGIIQKAGSNRVQVIDQNGKQQSLGGKQIALHFDPGVATEDFNGFAREYLEKVSCLAEEIDTELLWESLDTRGIELDPEKAAALYFGAADPQNQSALFRAAASDAIHFRQRGIRITVRTAEQVEEQKHLQEKLAEKEKLFDKFQAWADGVLGQNRGVGALQNIDEMLPFLNSLEQSVVNPGYSLDSRLKELIDTHSGPLKSPAEAVVELLVAGGRMPPEADPFILESGISLEFSDESLREASADWDSSTEARNDIETGIVFSIDDPETRDIDDAISVLKSSEYYLVGIHVADLTSLVQPGSSMDRDAMSRGTSVYLPHRQIRMLPEKVSCGAASLVEKKYRDTISCMLRVSSRLEILEWEFVQGRIRVDHNLSYDEADRIAESEGEQPPPFPEAPEIFAFLRDFTNDLRQERMAEGALDINRPESKITVEDQRIHLKMLDSNSASRRIISELMILFNRLAGRYASENRIPFIYRTQKSPEKDLPELPETGYDHLLAFQVFSMIEPGRVSLNPDRHFGLGLSAYAPSSSPIRRYGDLLNQRQIAAALKGGQPPYQREQLEELLAGLARAERTSRSLERKVSRLFALRYLITSRKKTHQAAILQETKNGYLVETVPECFRGILQTGEPRTPGSILNVLISKVDPESDTLIFSENS